MSGLILSGGEASEHFEISNGMKEGCVLAPVIFNLFFTSVLSHAVRDLTQSVPKVQAQWVTLQPSPYE